MRSRSGTSGANAALGASGQSKAMGASAANGVRRTLDGAASSGSQRGANGPLSPPRSVNGASTVEDEGLANQVAQVAALTEQVIVASTTSPPIVLLLILLSVVCIHAVFLLESRPKLPACAGFASCVTLAKSDLQLLVL